MINNIERLSGKYCLMAIEFLELGVGGFVLLSSIATVCLCLSQRTSKSFRRFRKNSKLCDGIKLFADEAGLRQRQQRRWAT